MWIILLDHSGSMGDFLSGKTEFAGRSKISRAAIKIDAAKQALIEHLSSLGAPTAVALIEFTSSASVVFEGLSTDQEGIQKVLDTLTPGDGTDISAALDKASEYVHNVKDALSIRALVISDGLSDREKAEASARQLAAMQVIIDLILIDPTVKGLAVARAVTAINGSISAVTTSRELSDQIAAAGEQERVQAELAAAIVGEYEREVETVTGKVEGGERLAFTAGYPGAMSPETWYSLLVYLHVARLQDQVEEMFRQQSTKLGLQPWQSRGEVSSQVERGTTFKLTPRIFTPQVSEEDVIFNPTTQKVEWYEDIQITSFRVRAETQMAGRFVHGVIDVEVGPALIAQIPFNIRVRELGAIEMDTMPVIWPAKSFRRIFFSYSHKDAAIVEVCVAVYEALAIHVYIDRRSLKSGEDWNPALHHLIQNSDIFQLCWSTASSQSKNVENEWRHALTLVGLKDEYFIRPVSWEHPFPSLPPELSHIHVWSLDISAFSRYARGLTGASIPPFIPMDSMFQPLQIHTPVLPILPLASAMVVAQVREDVAEAVVFLEETTELRYYPAPTLLVDEYAVKSVRALDTIDTPPDENQQKTRVTALTNIIGSVCMDFHLRKLHPATVNDNSFPGYFGAGSLLLEQQFDAIRWGCESVKSWVDDYLQNSGHTYWRKTLEELFKSNTEGFTPGMSFTSFFSTFLSTVSRVLSWGLQNRGDFEYQNTIHRQSWELLQSERSNLLLEAHEGRSGISLGGPFSEFVQVYDWASMQLIKALGRVAHLSSPIHQLFTVKVPTYGIYAPFNSLDTDNVLQSWALDRGLPAQLTLPQSPRVLLCLGARQHFERQLVQEQDDERKELAKWFQRLIIVHEHFHAILQTGLDTLRAPAAGSQSTTVWGMAASMNESLAAWMQLHCARGNAKLTELILAYIQAGPYPQWPYHGAEYVETLYQQKGIVAVRELIAHLRQDPRTAQAEFDALSNSL